MQVEWYGQSAFRLRGRRRRRSSIDPFGDMSAAGGARACSSTTRAIDGRWRRPAARHPRAPRPQRRRGRSAATPAILRSTAGHARVAARRGASASPPSTTRSAGTAARPEHDLRLHARRRARRPLRRLRPGGAARRAGRRRSGEVDLLLHPGRRRARRSAPTQARGDRRSGSAPRWVVPMHYRTERIGFLEPADDFLGRFDHVARLGRAALQPRRPAGRAPARRRARRALVS